MTAQEGGGGEGWGGGGGSDPSIQPRRAGASVSHCLSTRPRRDGRDEDRLDQSILARCEVIRTGAGKGGGAFGIRHSDVNSHAVVTVG